MVLEYYSMTTFRIAHAFATECETEAHTLPDICRQSKMLEESYTKLTNECEDRPYDVAYYCIFESRPKDMEISSYPDVAYCAISKKRAIGEASWKNYNIGEIATDHDTGTLSVKVVVLLDSDTERDGGITPEVQAYLTAHGKKVNTGKQPRLIYQQSIFQAPFGKPSPLPLGGLPALQQSGLPSLR